MQCPKRKEHMWLAVTTSIEHLAKRKIWNFYCNQTVRRFKASKAKATILFIWFYRKEKLLGCISSAPNSNAPYSRGVTGPYIDLNYLKLAKLNCQCSKQAWNGSITIIECGTWRIIFSGAWYASKKWQTLTKAHCLLELSSRLRWFHPNFMSSFRWCTRSFCRYFNSKVASCRSSILRGSSYSALTYKDNPSISLNNYYQVREKNVQWQKIFDSNK